MFAGTTFSAKVIFKDIVGQENSSPLMDWLSFNSIDKKFMFFPT